MNKYKIQIFYILSFLLTLLFSSSSVFAATSFIVDGTTPANSTGPCVGKTVCHISGDLTYSNIILQNGGKLSHRQGTLTVVNDFIIGSGSSSYFVGQALNVGHLLKITNASVLSLNSSLTSDPTSDVITDWMGSNYYDLAVTNTDVTYNGFDVNLTSGGYIKTRNAVINSDFSLQSNSTNCYFNTYANGYISVDGDATIKNIKIDVDGYVYVGENLSSDFSGAAGYYFYTRGNSQIDTPLSTQFLKAGLSVIGNLSFTGNTTTPTPFHFYATSGTVGDNVYSSGNINMYKMQIGSGSTTTNVSLGTIESRNGYININNTSDLYASDNLKSTGDIAISTITNVGLQDIISTTGNILLDTLTTFVSRDLVTYIGHITTQGTWTTHTYRHVNSKQNISITRSSLGGTLNATNLTNSGTTILQNISTYNRVGDILTTGDITLNNISTSSGLTTSITSVLGTINVSTGTTNTYNDLQAKLNITLNNIITLTADNITSTAGKIIVSTGTTHVYNNLSSYSDNIITSIVSYKANNISSNAKLTVSGSTIEITNTTDQNNEGASNIDISTGGDFFITNSTGNLQRSSIQVNGGLQIDNTLWKSQNLNINGYQTISSEKVGIYFKGGRDRYIYGNIFAGGGSIWLGTSATPDNGNVLLHRNTQVITNGGIKAYRDVSSYVNRFDYAPDTTITENTGLFSQIYNGALASNSGSVIGSGTWTNIGYLIDGSSSTVGSSSTIGANFEVTLARKMTLSKVCITADGTSPANIKIQFKDDGTTITNTQTLKLQSQSSSRQCFDINTTKAQKVVVSGYPDASIGFKEFELWGVPTDVANVSVSLNDDIILSNGSYEMGGNITSKNLNITSTSSKKIRITQYSNNGVFDSKSSVNITNTTSGNTLLTHSVGNELGLKFVTDTMSVGTGVLIDVSSKGYKGGNSSSEYLSKYGRIGNIIPGTDPMAAGNGGNYGGVGGYGVSGGGGGGADYVSFTGVSLGGASSCGINNGIVYCWGSNSGSQLGNGGVSGVNSTPLKASDGQMTNSAVSSLSLGLNHSCALKSGSVYCWGDNTLVQLGQYVTDYRFGKALFGSAKFNTSEDPKKPLLVDGLGDMSNNTISKITSWGNSSCALRSGVIYCWGEYIMGLNEFGSIYNGQLIFGGNQGKQIFKIPDGSMTNSSVSDLSVGSGSICALKSGAVYCAGKDNTYGQLGTADNLPYFDPKNTSILTTGVTQLSLGEYHGCALKSGSVYCWGLNDKGQLGNGTITNNSTPTVVSAGTMTNSSISKVVSGAKHSCALKSGSVYCWGDNTYGQVGDNTTATGRLIPVLVSNGVMDGGNSQITDIQAGAYHTCALRSDGETYCWGLSTSGQLGDTSITTKSYPSRVVGGDVGVNYAAGAGGGNLGYGGYGGSTTCTGSVGNNTLGNTRGGNGGGGVYAGTGTNWHGGGGAGGPTICTGGGGGTGGNSDTNPYRLGSGGGAGGLLTDNFVYGYGGNGGGMIRISSNTLNLYGSLLANGQVGGDYYATGTTKYGAGGGGAGGSILIRAKALNCNTGNAIQVSGGKGGAGTSTNWGGGGGGGGVITYYYTDKVGTCAGVLSKGTAGTGGGGADGQDGLSYESAGTTFDTLKSRVLVENSPAQANGTDEITIRAYFLDVNGVPLEGEYLVAEVTGSGGIGTGTINSGNPLSQTDANGMLSFPITSTVKGIKKVILKNAVTYTELQEQPTITFGVPQISISKVANKSVVNSGDVVTYTITLTNSGSGDAGGDTENAIVIEDVLPTGFRYYTTGPTAGSKWDTGSGTTQYYIFPETSGDGTSGNEERLRYTISDGISGPLTIPANGGKVRITFDTKVP